MITIIGAGAAGMALAKAFLRADEEVCFGVSNILKYQDIVKSLGKRARLALVQDAILASSEIVILAVPYNAALEIAAKIPDWKNKILVDISTPWLPDISGLAVGLISSAAENISQAAHNSRVVKAFNTMGAESINNPALVNGKVFMPVCSDNDLAKQEVMRLGNLIGLDAIDAGALSNARATEPRVFLWLQLTCKLSLGRTFEFGLLKKN